MSVDTESTVKPPTQVILNYGNQVLRRRWLVVCVAVAVTALVAVATFRARPTYRGVATVQIDRSDSNVLRFQDAVPFDNSYLSYQDYYQTQYRLIRSRAVALRTVEWLDLASDPAFLPATAPGPISRLWAAVTRPLSRKASSSGADADPKQPLVDAVLGGLRVEPIRSTRLVQISYLSHSPEWASRVANGVADAYISFGMEARVDTNENAGDFLTTQISSLRREVAELERALQRYGESKEIIPTSGEGNTALSALEDLQKAFTAAQAERAEKEAVYSSLQTAPDNAIPQGLGSSLIQELTAQVATLEREQAEMERKFKPGWPALAHVSSKLEQARERLRLETASIASGAREQAETAYQTAVAREANLSGLLETQKKAVLRLATDSIEYTNLRSEIAKKRETLDQLLKRQNEIALSSHLRDARQSGTRVIDRARVPKQPHLPNVKLNLLLGLLAGLGLGIGLALGLEILDMSIKSADEIRSMTGYASIGVIPEHRAQGLRAVRRGTAPATSDPDVDLVTFADPKSRLAEAYKDLRTATLLAFPDQPPRTILVTSCLAQEGKSATCLNLAIALAQAGKRVLLIDSDLRRPRLHRALNLSNQRGLSNFLSGNAPIEPLIQDTRVAGLSMLASGPIPPNPSELLGSRNFLALTQEFAETGGFDHLVFDSPPLLSVADSVVIATVVDGTILVVHCGHTPREALDRAATRLRHSNIRVLGAVLNGVHDADRAHYYHRYDDADEEEVSEPRERADTGA